MNTTAKQILNGALVGAKAGMQATVPMGATMRAGLELTSTPRRVPFSAVTKAIEHKLGMHVDEGAHNVAAWGGHLAYGATFGALFGAALAVVPQHKRSTALDVGLGTLVGVGLWAASYLGWLPAARVLPSATTATPAYNATNIAAHLVWGGATGAMIASSADIVDVTEA